MESMNLKEFVIETLKQIIAGVIEAQEFAQEHHSVVNPLNISEKEKKTGNKQNIDFDLAVSVNKETSTGGKAKLAGLIVIPFALSIEGQSASSNASVSRIKFSIPIEIQGQKLLGRAGNFNA